MCTAQMHLPEVSATHSANLNTPKTPTAATATAPRAAARQENLLAQVRGCSSMQCITSHAHGNHHASGDRSRMAACISAHVRTLSGRTSAAHGYHGGEGAWRVRRRLCADCRVYMRICSTERHSCAAIVSWHRPLHLDAELQSPSTEWCIKKNSTCVWLRWL